MLQEGGCADHYKQVWLTVTLIHCVDLLSIYTLCLSIQGRPLNEVLCLFELTR